LVTHQKLIRKLETLEIPTYLINCIKDFLRDRPQTVEIRQERSDVILSNTGTPQGSVLSPILYILYTNDLISMSENCLVVKFADDTALISKIGTESHFIAYQNELEHVRNWSEENDLILNATKTHELIFDFRKKNNLYGKDNKVKLGNVEIIPSESVKYLGVHIANNLTWDKHMSQKPSVK